MVGAAQAVKDAGKKDQIAVIGTCSPSQARKLINEGIIRESYIWNPLEAGKAIVNLAKLVIDGTPIVDGMDFPGLGKATVDPEKESDSGDQSSAHQQGDRRGVGRDGIVSNGSCARSGQGTKLSFGSTDLSTLCGN